MQYRRPSKPGSCSKKTTVSLKRSEATPTSRAGGRAENMRILLAFDEEHRLYIEAIADAIRTFRSYVEVAVTNTGELEAAVEHFHPQLVICSSPIPSNPVEPQL